MIPGVVNARHEALVGLRVRGPGGVELGVDVIVDSGFTASLTLPMAVVTALALARQSGGSKAGLTDAPRGFQIRKSENQAWSSASPPG